MNDRSPTLALALTLAVVTSVVPWHALQGQSGNGDMRVGAAALWIDPGPAAGLESPITVTLEEVLLTDAIEAVARKTGLTLTYSRDIVPGGWRVTYRGVDVPGSRVFREILTGTGLRIVEMESGHLVLTEGETETEEGVGSVAGTVTGLDSGSPLPGISVRISGTELSADTGPDGRYSISGVPSGPHTLVASSIGYRRAVRRAEIRNGERTVVDFTLETEAVSMDEIVVTGTLTPTPIEAVPSPITVIRAADLERQNVESVDEIFRIMVPGGVTSDDSPGLGGYTRYSVRGTSSLSTVSTLKVYVDGVEVVDPAFINNINPDIIERIEVVSGPQASTVYGSGAISGVMQIFTKKGMPGTGEPIVSASVGLGVIDGRYVDGTPGSEDYRVSVSGGGESYGYNVAGSWEEEGNWKPHHAARAATVSASGELEQGPLTAKLGLRYRIDRGDDGLDPQFLELGFDTDQVPPTLEFDNRSAGYSLALEYEAARWWSHELVLGVDENDQDFFTSEPRRAFPGDTLNTVSTLRTNRAGVRYHSILSIPRHGPVATTVTFGGDYSHRSGTSIQGAAGPEPEGTFDGTTAGRSAWATSGVFGQAQLDVSETFFLTLGLHGDRSETTPGTAWSPRVGAAWSTAVGDVDLKLRGAYGSALVSPTPNRVNGSRSGSSITFPNQDLEPERQRGWDAGVELYFAERGSLSFTYYDQTAEDLIDRVSFGRNQAGVFESQYQNLGEVRNRGFEASGTVAVTEALRVNAVFGSATSEVKSLSEGYSGFLEPGEEMLGVPEWTAGATLSWTPLRGTRLTGNLSHRAIWREVHWVPYFEALFGGNAVPQKDFWLDYPSWTKFNVGLSQELGERFTGFVQVDNLTNDYAFEYSDLVTTRGREMSIGLRYTSR